jgi:hypothetical protein
MRDYHELADSARNRGTAMRRLCDLLLVPSAGGKVVTPKTPIPGMGAFARVADSEGNVLGLFETG